jgi:hypothetical protein
LVTLKDSAKRPKLSEDALQKNYMKHIPSCQEMKEHENDLIDFAKFKEEIPKISEEFHTRFNDSLKPKLHLFNNPMDPEVTQQPFDLQMELCDLQSDATFQSKKKKKNLQKIFGKCYLKRSSPSFKISPLKFCHYLEALCL